LRFHLSQVWPHCSRAALWCCFNVEPFKGRRARRPHWCNLFRTVWSEIRTLVLPTVSLAVCTAVTKRHFNVSRMTIYRLMIRLRDTCNTSDRSRSGRPRVTTLRQDRHIQCIHLRNRFVTAVHTARLTVGRTNVRISDHIVFPFMNFLKLRGRWSLNPPLSCQQLAILSYIIVVQFCCCHTLAIEKLYRKIIYNF
jgi:transposase